MNRKRISRLLIFAGILAGLFGSYALLALFLMSRSYGWHGTLELLLGNGTSAQIQSVCLGSCVAFLPYYPASACASEKISPFTGKTERIWKKSPCGWRGPAGCGFCCAGSWPLSGG